MPAPKGCAQPANAYRWRLARNGQDLAAALRLRARIFRRSRAPLADFDALDRRCQHLLIETEAGIPVGCCRLLPLPGGRAIGASCSARSHDLRRLCAYPEPMMELGRLCIAPEHSGPDTLRLMFGAILSFARQKGAAMLFGCGSFAGADPGRHAPALAFLARHHGPPARWRPGPGPLESFPLKEAAAAAAAQARRPPALPPLLRAYLAHGGWCGEHAAIDRDLDTLHVFTALELARIPPARWHFLRKSMQPPHEAAPPSPPDKPGKV